MVLSKFLFLSILILLSASAVALPQKGITDRTIPLQKPAIQQTESKPISFWKEQDLDDLVNQEASKYKIDPLLIDIVILQESGGHRKAVSPKGAVGLMQLMPDTARKYGANDRKAADQNVRAGLKYFVHLLDRYNGNVTLALAAYNAGENAVDKYNGVPPYSETRNYIKSIAHQYRILKTSLTRNENKSKERE